MAALARKKVYLMIDLYYSISRVKEVSTVPISYKDEVEIENGLSWDSGGQRSGYDGKLGFLVT